MFHLDNDVRVEIQPAFAAYFSMPRSVITARDLGMRQAPDGAHLLAAAQTSRIFITYNRKDFITMQDAWLR